MSFWSCGCLPIFIKLKSFPISLLSFVYHTHCCICLGNLINLYPCLSNSNLMPILVKIRFILLCLYKEVQHQKTHRPQIPSTSQPNRNTQLSNSNLPTTLPYRQKVYIGTYFWLVEVANIKAFNCIFIYFITEGNQSSQNKNSKFN